MKAYKDLIRYALQHECRVSVWDGEEWQVKKSAKAAQIVEAVESVDEAELVIYDQDNNRKGWAWVSAYGLADDETVMDYTDNVFLNGWFNQYEAAQ